MTAAVACIDRKRVRAFNDAFRQSFGGGRIVATAGVAALSNTTRAAVQEAARAFDRFDTDNDPYDEHDFGVAEVGGVRVFWKIDTYDRSLRYASPDRSDPAATNCVLTIMLAEES